MFGVLSWTDAEVQTEVADVIGRSVRSLKDFTKAHPATQFCLAAIGTDAHDWKD